MKYNEKTKEIDGTPSEIREFLKPTKKEKPKMSLFDTTACAGSGSGSGSVSGGVTTTKPSKVSRKRKDTRRHCLAWAPQDDKIVESYIKAKKQGLPVKMGELSKLLGRTKRAIYARISLKKRGKA